MSGADQTTMQQPAERVRRNPFAQARPSDFFWVQLKPVFKARQLVQAERLARIAVTSERVADLELLRLQAMVEGEAPPEAGRNTLEVLVDHKNRRLRFGPDSDVVMVPARRGLAGFLLAQLIDWCQRNCTDYRVTPVPMHSQEALSTENRQLKEKILARAGFELVYTDETQTQGRALADSPGTLSNSWNAERVQSFQVSELWTQLRHQESANLQQQTEINSLRAVIENYKRNDLGHRFAIGCLIVFSIFQALLLFWVVVR
ncbi:MAG TPA: hypothetical protein ENI17_17515 [Pseudomonas xinjiangensis]|uniref:Uncharacterized protein n=2 Tax=root TaxID=1 RepID=A0A7V1BQ96_9GAMM|nr:hypothetical protein [Halopseudomonas xinjiangensis]HEC49404.1 hypothetical protein [Halopseudomonas xinjiangensis]